VAGCSILGVVVKVLSPFYQDNAELLALAVPANVGLAAAVLAAARRVRV
jgi:hypothetical protein